ncbi:MAG: hypothetical protein ABIN36_15470 [Ferruginibacter sp.]
MKKPVKITLIVLGIILAGGIAYWEHNKKKIVRNAVENAVSNKTDSLYYIHYDSSSIDAASGSASFYNVTFQSDSLQQQLAQFDTASAASIYNIHVAEVSIRGANIPALLSNSKVEASSVKIIRPIIYIISSGTKKEKKLTRNDTLALYEKILGKLKSIKAGEISIEDGQLNFTHKIDTPYVSLSGININMKNVLIDSTKDYDNIVSYLIKDVDVSVKRTFIKNEQNNSVLTFTGLVYDARQKIIKLQNFQQKDNDSGKIIFDINNTYIKGLNTDSFILNSQLKAEELVSDGGLLTFYSKKATNTSNDEVEIDNNFFDEALLNKITLGNTKIMVYKKDKPKDPPFVLTNVKFSASEIQNLYSGTSIKNLISKSNWNLSADGFDFFTADKVYKLSLGAFDINKATGKMHIDHFSVIPQMSEAAYIKTLKEQHDLYNVVIKNIYLEDIDTKKLIADKMLIAGKASIQPTIKVSLDRTVAPFTGSKVGNYPHQLIQKVKFPIYVKTVVAHDAYISYTERNPDSKQQGTIFFSKANGTIDNVTNIPDYLAKNNMLVVKASALLMGKGKLQTKWNMPLDTKNGAFTITGSAGTFDPAVLNSVIEPLALASIKSGTIKSVQFSMNGNDAGAKGTSTLLYNNLKIEALKVDSNDLKKRGLISLVANAIIKDDNPKNGETRVGDIDLERDKTRSFFNLVWKGIMKAAKRTALGKNDDENKNAQ